MKRVSCKVKLFCIVSVMLNFLFAGQAVFATQSISISVSPSTVEIDASPGEYESSSQTITASTTSLGGYTINFTTSGPSSALIEQNDNTRTIPTFTLPPGSTSIPVESLPYGYGYSIDNGSNYYPVPAPSSTNTGLFVTDSPGTQQHTLTYGVKAPTNASEGVYTNTFTITAVANIAPCPADNICYYGNGDDGSGTMPNQSTSSSTDTTLIASNFSRPGYGFVGWNTAIDGTGTNYGPNQTITTGDLSSTGLQLYARWVPSSGTMQTWSGCDSLSQGDIIGLTDARDNSTYAVAKYADDQCWMIENLHLDLSDSSLVLSDQNTNSPTASFVNTINNNHPTSTNTFCDSNSAVCVNQILHNTNNTNRNLTASYDANNNSSSWYAYGHYYNWYTATAGNGTYDFSTPGATVSGDLCPANWHLPTGYGDTGDFSKLDVLLGGSGRNQASGTPEGLVGSARWRSFPLNYMYSGEQRNGTAYNRAISNSHATLNTYSVERTTNLWIKSDGAYMNKNNTVKVRGQTIRCVFSTGYQVEGNIHYDANGGTGTMSDDVNVNLGIATAAANSFTKQYSIFAGWNTSSDGSGVVVSEGSPVADAAEHMGITEGGTLTLYANWRPNYTLVYDGNGASAGSMSVATVDGLSTGNHTLVAPNYSRTGYGFVGWSLDSSAATKLANNQAVTIYGPNERVRVDNTFLSNADPVTHQLTLYAVWLPEESNQTLQTFGATECNALSVGKVLALKDARDNNTYAVAKLGDNNCWMIENLRLDPASTAFNSSNTNNPTSSFVSDAPSSASGNTLCKTDDSVCIDKIGYNSNTINRSLPASYNSNAVGSSWYGYGIMYNWYTASSGNGTYSMSSGTVAGDICPLGWRLPTGGTNGEFVALNNAINGSLTGTDAGLVAYPANFTYSGDYNYDKPGGRHSYGRFWSATPNGNAKAFRLGVTSSGATPSGSWNKWDAFAVRCIVDR